MKQDIEENAKELESKKVGRTDRPVNHVTEYLFTPQMWKLDPVNVHTWLTEEDIKKLNEFDFDYGDILYALKVYSTRAEVGYLLMCTQKDLNDYCMILWHKPWDIIWNALFTCAKNEIKENVFRPWADKGNGIAMSVMRDASKVIADEEGEKKELTIRLVNDIENGD